MSKDDDASDRIDTAHARAARYASEITTIIEDAKRRSEAHPACRDGAAAMATALDTLRAQREELERADTMMTAQRTRNRHLFGDAPDAYVLTSAEGVVQSVNMAALRLFERDEDLLLGQPLSTFVVRDDVAAHLELLAAVSAGKESEERALRIRPRANDAPLVPTTAVASHFAGSGEVFWRFRSPAAKKDTARPAVMTSFPRLRVLVVCHDDETRMPIELAASEHHAETRCTDTISGAIEILREFPADVVVADMFIRSTAGVDIITELRASNRRPVPLGIAISGLGAGDSRHALAVGFHAFLMKPVTIESARSAFQATARVLLKRSRRHKKTPVRT